jgi:ectoine hydroxylase-related dioxygenase (phytanoyl-CoA dioxygenase family)
VQALVFTQSMLHTGWSNFTTTDRKAIIVSWVAAGVPFGESN